MKTYDADGPDVNNPLSCEEEAEQKKEGQRSQERREREGQEKESGEEPVSIPQWMGC